MREAVLRLPANLKARPLYVDECLPSKTSRAACASHGRDAPNCTGRSMLALIALCTSAALRTPIPEAPRAQIPTLRVSVKDGAALRADRRGAPDDD